MVKSTIWLVLITSFTSHIHSTHLSSSIKYEQEARDWAYNAFFSPASTINEEERSIILNFIYCAYWRSRATIDAQKAATAILETIWKGWQNIAQTRMNPSHKAPYCIDYKIQEEIFKKFQDAQVDHQNYRQTYDIAADYTIKGSHSKAHSAAVTILKDRARHIIIKEFINVKKTLGDLFEFACGHLRLNQDETENLDIFRFDYLDTLTSFIPTSYAAHSFIEAEKLQKTASIKTWQTLETITMVNQKIWEAVETARMEYYEAHYDAIIYYLQQKNLPIPPCKFWKSREIQNELIVFLPLKVSIHLFSLMA
jgi:hypothetical protein